MSSKQTFSTPNQLTISNCGFENFFYDLNAIINTNQYGSLMSISSTSFSRVSNCGSIVKNYNSYPLTVGSVVTDKFTNKQAYFNYITLSTMKAWADVYHGTDITTNPFSTTCSSTDCFSLTIQSSTFKYLGAYKELLTGMNVVPEAYQRFQAMALNLISFNGDIVLKSNTFQNNYVMIDGCNQVDMLSAVPPANANIEYLGATSSLYQIKSVVSIMNHPRLIVLGENIFTENVSVKGAVVIESTKQKQYPMIIVGNQFTRNSGFLYSDALYIRKKNDLIFNADLTQSTHYCAGIYFTSNTFTNNVG